MSGMEGSGAGGEAMDLGAMGAEELRERFGTRGRPGRVVASRVLRAAILQVARENREAMEAGREPAFQGHVRALWHRAVEPVLARLGPEERLADPYGEMVQVLSRMVFGQRVIRYSDLCLTDPNWEERRIGGARPDIVVVGEKRGQFRTLRRVHERAGVTVCVTAGFPSGVSSEYTARHVLEATGGRPEVSVVSVMDFDPTSDLIGRAFCQHVERFGLQVVRHVRVFRPEHVPEGLLRLVARPVPVAGRRGGIVARWLAEGGGVGGQALRIDVDVVPPEQLEALILEAVAGVAGG